MLLKFLRCYAPDGEAGGGGGESTDGGGGAGFSESAFAEYQAEVETLRNETRASNAELARIRKAISGERDDKPKGKWADPLLDKLLEADRRGNSMPLTAQAIMAIQEEKDAREQAQEEINELKKALKALQDPVERQHQQVYANLDVLLTSGLEKVFGDVPHHIQKATASMISDHLVELQQHYPDVWQKVRMDPRAQSKMINHFIMQQVPQSAKEIMRKTHEDNEPLTAADLNQAFDDLREIPDPVHRAQAQKILRQQVLEMKHEGRFRRA